MTRSRRRSHLTTDAGIDTCEGGTKVAPVYEQVVDRRPEALPDQTGDRNHASIDSRRDDGVPAGPDALPALAAPGTGEPDGYTLYLGVTSVEDGRIEANRTVNIVGPETFFDEADAVFGRRSIFARAADGDSTGIIGPHNIISPNNIVIEDPIVID